MPAGSVDPAYSDVRDLADLPAADRERIEAFFRVYKDLPAGGKRVELRGWGGAEEAQTLIREAIDAAR